jgi:hypothetical protein
MNPATSATGTIGTAFPQASDPSGAADCSTRTLSARRRTSRRVPAPSSAPA